MDDLRGLRALGSALRLPGLRLLLSGWFVYCLVRKGSRVAILLFAYERGGPSAAATIAVAQLAPAALVAPLAGALAERLPASRALAAGYAAQGTFLAASGVAVAAHARLGVVAVLAAVAAALFTLTRPVYQATLPDVVTHPAELTLGNAAGVWADGLASALGPLIAGAAFAAGGAGPVLVALGAAGVAVGLASLRLTVGRSPVTAPVVEQLLAGFRHVTRDAALLGLSAVGGVQYAVVGLLDVLTVVTAVQVLHLSSSVAGALAAAIGVGSVGGGVLAAGLAGRTRLAKPLLAGSLAVGAPLALAAASTNVALSLALMAAYGAGRSVVVVASQTLLQRTVPDDVATRVFGLQEGLTQAGTAVGSALGPVLVTLFGARGALVATAVLLPGAVLLSRARLRMLDERAVVPGPVFQLLRRVPFLAMLPLRSIEQLARGAGERDVATGTVVVREGEPGDRYYVVARGRLSVTVDGRPARELTAGTGFGEIALLHQVPRTATVAATQPSRLVTIDREGFLSAVTGLPVAHSAARSAAEAHLEDDARRNSTDDAD